MGKDQIEDGMIVVGRLVNSYQKSVGKDKLVVTVHQVEMRVKAQDGSLRVLQLNVDDWDNRKIPEGPVQLGVRVSASVSKDGKGFVNYNMR